MRLRQVSGFDAMGTFSAGDGTALTYRTLGHGPPLVCLGGGPLQDTAYLGELGGLPNERTLVLPDWRRTAAQGVNAYRCDRLVDDVEALRRHLRLDRFDLLAHCAGANVAVRYAERYPDRLARLVLVTPSTRAVGSAATADDRRAIMALRHDEPWYPAAAEAFDRLQTDAATDADWDAITPFSYGRWDDAAQAHAAAEAGQRHPAAAAFGAEGAFDPPATRAALARLPIPVLVLAGEVDIAAPPRVTAEVAARFPSATFTVLAGAAHFPWLDDPATFCSTVAAFLA